MFSWKNQKNISIFQLKKVSFPPALMTQSDACQTGGKEVAGSVPDPETFFHGD